MGTFNVFIVPSTYVLTTATTLTDSGTALKPAFTQSGDKGNVWLLGTAPITQAKDFYVSCYTLPMVNAGSVPAYQNNDTFS